MVLSDRTIKEEIAAGRLVFDPYDESLVQPSSVDMRVDRRFRVFHNYNYPYIDVRQPMEDLTGLVEAGKWDKTPPGPELPAEIVQNTAAKYREACERLMK